MAEPRYAGIDVAKDTVELALSPSAAVESFANEPGAHEAIAKGLLEHQVALVVLEASGGYEFALACTLQAAGPGRSGGQSTSGARFCQSDGLSGEDRSRSMRACWRSLRR